MFETILFLKLTIFMAIGDGYAVIGESPHKYETQAECYDDGHEILAGLKKEYPLDKFFVACEPMKVKI